MLVVYLVLEYLAGIAKAKCREEVHLRFYKFC